MWDNYRKSDQVSTYNNKKLQNISNTWRGLLIEKEIVKEIIHSQLFFDSPAVIRIENILIYAYESDLFIRKIIWRNNRIIGWIIKLIVKKTKQIKESMSFFLIDLFQLLIIIIQHQIKRCKKCRKISNKEIISIINLWLL